ncbi:MAG TPA: protease modulator HflC [Clostridiales bacterium]|nr:protease modulator HflC [Clostridiales bacterium]
MKKAKGIGGIVVFVIVIAALIILGSSIVVTNENQYSVIKRFGKIERVINTAGLAIKTPFIEDVYKIPKSIQVYDMKESNVITMDKKTMVADSYVLWKITDPIKFAQTLSSNVALAEQRIDPIVYNSMKNVISSISQAEVISGRDGSLNNEFMENIGSSMSPYGIELISVETKHLDLPSDNKAAVFDRMISERAQIAATYTAEGAAQAQKIQNETDKQVAISVSNAKADAAKIIAEGEADYMRILSEAYSNEKRADFYTFIRSLEAAKASLKGDNKTLILSEDSPIAQIFYKVE